MNISSVTRVLVVGLAITQWSVIVIGYSPFWVGPLTLADSFQIPWLISWHFTKIKRESTPEGRNIKIWKELEAAAHEMNRDDEPNAIENETTDSSRKKK